MPVSFLANTNPLNLPAKIIRLFFGARGKTERNPEAGEQLQKVIGYRFRSIELLSQALTHKSSIVPEDTIGLLSNERLEFLGDAVLNFLVTEHLYHRHPEKSEAQLPYWEQSRKLASLVHEELLRVLPLPSGFVQQADLYLLKRVQMPAVLVELGSLNHPGEAAKLQEPRFQEDCARAISEAIRRYMLVPETGGFPATQELH